MGGGGEGVDFTLKVIVLKFQVIEETLFLKLLVSVPHMNTISLIFLVGIINFECALC